MKQEDRLKIQAWLDGELAPQESAIIADLVDSNLEAKAVADELETIQNILKSGENGAKLEDSRDFYWSQIQRQIESEESTATKEPNRARLLESHSSGQGSLLHWLLPAGSLLAISALILNYDSVSVYNNSDETPNNPSIYIETPSGLTENSASLLEEESTMTPEVGVFSFEGIQGDRNLISPEDPNTLPESIENPER